MNSTPAHLKHRIALKIGAGVQRLWPPATNCNACRRLGERRDDQKFRRECEVLAVRSISFRGSYQVAGSLASGMTSATISHRSFRHNFRSARGFWWRKTTTLSGWNATTNSGWSRRIQTCRLGSFKRGKFSAAASSDIGDPIRARKLR